MVVGVHAMPLTAALCLQSLGPPGGGGHLAGWCCVGVCCGAPLLCVVTVRKIRLLGGRVVDVKYPCSCVAFSPFPSHHLGLALGGAIVLLLALPYRKWSETSSGDEPPRSLPSLGFTPWRR